LRDSNPGVVDVMSFFSLLLRRNAQDNNMENNVCKAPREIARVCICNRTATKESVRDEAIVSGMKL